MLNTTILIKMQAVRINTLTTLHEVLKRNWGNFCFVAIILINILIPAVINEQVERSFF
jgi:predicted KAP-like P-loop ATPase